MLSSFRLVALTLVASALVACSSKNDATADAGVDASEGIAACTTDSRAQSFTPGMSEPGTNHATTVTLETANPAPPVKGNNVFTIVVKDTSGAPVDGLTVTTKPFMPDHGHGTSITPETTALGSGRYQIELVNLFMPGIWTITFTLSSATVNDTATFTFCING